ncbi:DUF4292 domain-containing protein [Anaeromyxobacter diazotrophicus]|uniref:DUF4292 domain-containing protein n=1 Tax=Anaeromyxobacter diazotrophicus TaxID=2590199 RepID=A0A7I9VHZ0_9BACT|nr:DUF4292 domain-containing protein [Anaeromyxobacter diazotrophicus]GEJ55859.1 hypothetical protein AMYX_06000 [Anaeromyxobacter diazotrophicus]
MTTRALAAALLALLAACARVPPPTLARDPSALLDQVRVAQARVQRVRGAAALRIASPSFSGTVTEFIAAEKPDRVHLETLDFFGTPVAVLVAGGGRFAFYDARAKVFYRGEATPRNISRLLPFELPVEELVTILCGSAPLLPGAPLEVGQDDGFLLLTLGLGDVGQRVAVGEEASVGWSRVRKAGPPGARPEDLNPGYDLEFRAFADRGGARFPREVKLDAPASGARLQLSWHDDVEVNGALERELFQLAPPPGVRVEELPASGAGPAAVPPPGRRE